MNTEGQDLGPYEAVPDVLALAAIERAIRHGAEDAWITTVGEHLGYRRDRHSTRRLRQQLEQLRVLHGWVASEERLGREHWRLTPDGERHLAKVRQARQLGALPESPQHRDWRRARAVAAERMDRFRGLLCDAMEDAGTAQAASIAPPSGSWLWLSRRLAAALWLVGSATYCRDEWPEPRDDCIDTDPDPGPPPGRRALTVWGQREAIAKGDEP